MTESLTLHPIGVIRTDKSLKFDAPHQPNRTLNERSEIELIKGKDFEQALRDLDGFEYIWLVWWFHKNANWKPMVMPPRGKEQRRGVFATRSPHRPNAIGLTAVPLISVKGRKIIIGTNDLIDGTPILDIKPYLTAADCFPGVKQGWIAEIEKEDKEGAKYSVEYSKLAEKQLDWLKSQEINFMPRAAELLSKDPSPHRTRRISKVTGSKLFRMGCGAWRVFFALKGTNITISHIAPGYPLRSLQAKSSAPVPFRKEQLAFLKIWEE